MKKLLFIITIVLFTINTQAQLNPFGYYYAHKKDGRIKYISILTLEESTPNYVEVDDNGSPSTNRMEKLKDGYFEENGKFIVIKDETSFYIIKCNYYDHFTDGKDLAMEDFYFYSKNRKELKTLNVETLKSEALQYMKQAADIVQIREDAKKAEHSKALSESLKTYKPVAFDPAEVKKFSQLVTENITEKFGSNYKIHKSYFWRKNWDINRNDYDKVLSKTMKVAYVVKDIKTNKCYYYLITAGYEFTGASYDDQLRFFNGSGVDLQVGNKYVELNAHTLYALDLCDFQ